MKRVVIRRAHRCKSIALEEGRNDLELMWSKDGDKRL